MRKKITDKELISAYLDGELSQSEKKYIEERIKNSLELKKELEDYKSLKDLTSGSYDRIPESPFFETRLMANLNVKDERKINLRKMIPITSLVIFTFGLMMFLKINPKLIDDLIDQQKSNLESFYKENLQPLLYAANLTNEDIFNFAVYKELPLDSANQQILRLGNDSAGAEYFEIKNGSDIPNSNNLKSFVAALDLDEKKVKMIDSIIGSYSDQLSTLVLVNDKNSVAINPNIWNTRKMILADIVAFAQKHAGHDYTSLLPSGLAEIDKSEVLKWVNDAKSVKADQYIFLTPDSIFEDNFVFNIDEYKTQMVEIKENLNELKHRESELRESRINFDSVYANRIRSNEKSKVYEIYVDKDFIKVNVPGFVEGIPEIELPDFDSIALVIKEATENIRTVRTQGLPNTVNNNNYKFDINTNMPQSKSRREVDLDVLLKQKNKENNQKIIEQQKVFKKQSVENNTKEKPVDSLLMMQNNELKKEMDKLRKELRKFREEIKDSQKDDKDSSNQKNITDPDYIEI